MTPGKTTQAQNNSSSSHHSLDERIGTIENIVTQLLVKKSDLSGIHLPAYDETNSSNRGSIDDKGPKPKKRSLSVDRERGVKRKKSQKKKFKCTLCEREYQIEWTLFRHYRTDHGISTPERVHEKNLNGKKTPVKKTVNICKKTLNVTVSPNENKNESYDCKLCDAVFKSISARNTHYTGKHGIQDEKLLFFPNGSGLVDSSLEHQISLKPDRFRAIAERPMTSTACKLCTIPAELDERRLKWHYENNHKVFQMCKVEPLIRLNNTDIKYFVPSLTCDHCSDEFPDTNALEKHLYRAHPNNFMTCKICNKSIEKKVYNDHVRTEHADLYSKKVNNVTDECVTQSEVDKLYKRGEIRLKRAFELKDATIAKDTEKKKEAKSTRAGRASFIPETLRAVPLMYLCGACHLATSSYDNAVAHSQAHILNNVTKESGFCEICELKFDVDFAIHEQMHLSNDDLDRDSFRFVSYNYGDLTSDKWFDMFGTLAESKVNRITSASIYFSTRCVCLKLQSNCKDATRQFTLFQCVTCKRYVDPDSIESHVEQQKACTNQLSSYPCYTCLKTFYTQEVRDEHNLTHEIPGAESKYRIVLFNDQNAYSFNKTLLENSVKSIQGKKGNIDNQNLAKQRVAVTPKRVRNEGNKLSTKHKATSNPNANKDSQERVAHVYRCQCGLCFDRLKFLFMHLKNCSPDLKIVTINCKCGLVFDRQNYAYHCKVHRDDITTFSVKEVIIRDDIKIDVSGMAEEFKMDCLRKRRKCKGTDEVTKQVNRGRNDEDANIANLKQYDKAIGEMNLPNKQVNTDITSLLKDNVLIQKQGLLTDAEMSANADNEHQSTESNSIQNSEDIKENKSMVENSKVTENFVVREELVKVEAVTESQNTEENKSMYDSTMEVDSKETIYNKLSNESHEEEKTKFVNIETGNIVNGCQIPSPRLDTNESIRDDQELKEEEDDDNILIKTISLQNKDAIYNQDTTANEEIMEDKMMDSINSNTSDNLRASDSSSSIKTENNPKSNEGTESCDIIKAIKMPNEKYSCQISDDTNTEDHDEEELLKEPVADKNDSLITDDESVDSEVDLPKMKKKIEALFSSSSSNKVKQELLDYVLNRVSKLNK